MVRVANHELVESFVGLRPISINKDAILNLTNPLMHGSIRHILSRSRLVRKLQSVANLAVQASLLCSFFAVARLDVQLLD